MPPSFSLPIPASPTRPRSFLGKGGSGKTTTAAVTDQIADRLMRGNLFNRICCGPGSMENSAPEFVDRLINGKIDLRDKEALENVFASTRFDAVVHFAGLKAVGESVQKPLLYYDNNVNGTVNLLEVMSSHGCKKKIPLIIGPRRPGDAEILFSSTAKAERDLNWKAKYGIDEMCRDQWNWASKNPNGYGSADSIKQNGHRGYGSADPCKQNGQYGSTESVKQNGNGHLH